MSSKNHVSTVFSGMKELMERHKEQGGNICVVSYSFSKNIYRDYEKNNLPKPDLVFGSDRHVEERKQCDFYFSKVNDFYNYLF